MTWENALLNWQDKVHAASSGFEPCNNACNNTCNAAYTDSCPGFKSRKMFNPRQARVDQRTLGPYLVSLGSRVFLLPLFKVEKG